MKICKIVDCNKKHHAKDLCGKHYARKKRLGDPNSLLTVNQYKTPEERFDAFTAWRGDCLIWVGSYSGKVEYGRIWLGDRSQPAHVYAWERVHGPVPDGMVVDHKDHCNTRCCNVDHLRLATHQQNTQNKSGLRSDNTSGFRGVSWSKATNKWEARVSGKVYGHFTDKLDAARIAEQARLELFGEFAGKG